MACKYKYKDKWYSESEVKNQILRDISLNDVIAELSTQMSYTVEINTAKKQLKKINNPGQWSDDEIDNFFAEEFADENNNTEYYSNLTVPGGTNYTENEISTPLITPSIKGHAQFSTNNGIGWFRGDEQVKDLTTSKTRLTVSQEGSDGFGYVLGLFNFNQERIGKIVYRSKTYLKEKGFPIVNELHLGFEEAFQRKGYFQDALIELLNYDDSPIFISNGRVINNNVFKAINKLDDNKLNITKIEDGYIITLNNNPTKTRRILEVQSDLFQKGRDKEDLISKKGKYYRVLNINLGKDVTFEPKTYSEAFEQGEDGKWYPKYNKYGGYWRSNIPEISASKNIGSAVMGNWTASGMPQTTEFFIYELEDGVEPDYDISHLEIGDFKQLQEVRYRKPVKGKLIGEFKLTPDIYKIFNENYDLMSEDGGINKHYELEDEFEKKYGYRPYDEKAPEGVVEIFNKIQDDYWKEQSLKVEKALQSIHNKYDEQVKQNQFLQLLNKDNNWVTFFVKSIIQDSAKKGYEKVLFPSGNTASKVEGHSTLEEFKKQKEDRIKELEKQKSEIKYKTNIINLGKTDEFLQYQKENKILYDKYNKEKNYEEIGKLTDKFIGQKNNFKTEISNEPINDSEKRKLNNINQELEQLKQELERVETEGFGALRPIYNFYENTVTNIIKKQGYNPVLITDEYGNTWNEIEIKPEHLQSIKFSSPDIQYSGDLAIEEKLADEYSETKTTYSNSIFTQFFQWVKDMIELIKNKSKIDKLFRDINAGRYRNINVLITSEVVPIDSNLIQSGERQYSKVEKNLSTEQNNAKFNKNNANNINNSLSSINQKYETEVVRQIDNKIGINVLNVSLDKLENYEDFETKFC